MWWGRPWATACASAPPRRCGACCYACRATHCWSTTARTRRQTLACWTPAGRRWCPWTRQTRPCPPRACAGASPSRMAPPCSPSCACRRGAATMTARWTRARASSSSFAQSCTPSSSLPRWPAPRCCSGTCRGATSGRALSKTLASTALSCWAFLMSSVPCSSSCSPQTRSTPSPSWWTTSCLSCPSSSSFPRSACWSCCGCGSCGRTRTPCLWPS
mmetsp:Transcript_17462/g.44491  ORF Transcript_17462/g.44491 Transcript_17462/m.44491 type:complete len:216 (+) Transcript_17462:286-933(+)